MIYSLPSGRKFKNPVITIVTEGLAEFRGKVEQRISNATTLPRDAKQKIAPLSPS